MFAINYTVNKSDAQKAARLHAERVVNLIRLRLAQYIPTEFLSSALVDAMEVQCSEPDCVPTETLIIMHIVYEDVSGCSIQPKKWATKVLKPLAAVEEEDIISIDFPFQLYDPQVHTMLTDLRTSISSLEPNQLSTSLPLARMKRIYSELTEMIETAESTFEQHTQATKKQYVTAEDDVVRVVMEPSKPTAADAPSVGQMQPSVINTNLKMTANDRPIVAKTIGKPTPRHEKGQTRRGACPCCDPDNLELLNDKMIFLELPPT
jgi:hypothetical protein